ncbi:MAG: GNAT family N-acetyltransferase [Actinomycetes bacterium]
MAPTSALAGARLRPDLVHLSDERRDDLLEIDQWAFAFADDGLDVAPALLGFEWDRTVGAEVDGRLVGVSSVYSPTMPVPGGEVPVAGLTWVGVHPQHRRRGVLRTLMAHHLESVRERGIEPVSALNAAEPAIYGRFGYGLATRNMRLTLPRGAAFREVPGTDELAVRLEKADPEKHASLVAVVFDGARSARPGMVSRPSAGLQQKMLADPAHWREGGESLRVLVVEDDAGQPRGYALFRRKEHWTDAGPAGTVTVREMAAVDAASSAVVWSRLTDLDLMKTVQTDARPVDDPLVHQLVDVRAAEPRVSDGIWVRLVDVGAALAARRYTRDVDVVLDVRDELCPWNVRRWRLAGGPGGAVCEATSAAADLSLDVRAIGSAYLGGETLSALASAGFVDELSIGALDVASAAFAWHVAPFCGWEF